MVFLFADLYSMEHTLLLTLKLKTMIKVLYNGNPNLPIETNHRSMIGLVQMEKSFETWGEAVEFHIECSFYGGSITTLEELMQYCPQEIKQESEIIYSLEDTLS